MNVDLELCAAFRFAVPIWAGILARRPVEHINERIYECIDVLNRCGDVFPERAGALDFLAPSFQRTAEGIAILSLLPGGCTLGDLHFEFPYPAPDERAPILNFGADDEES
jgi:hypothetical protein